MSFTKQLEAKAKANSIIKSCCSYQHINTANNYIALYHKKYEDELGKQELLIELDKRSTLLWVK
jgi:hypothetical protein|tara:strand:- start:14701 stop:14892 length:192 start_codon:yes stop_codon:yes gene_type:complete